MQTFLVRGFLPMVIGAALLAGCATKDDFKITQTTADAARMQAEEARVAADRAVNRHPMVRARARVSVA